MPSFFVDFGVIFFGFVGAAPALRAPALVSLMLFVGQRGVILMARGWVG